MEDRDPQFIVMGINGKESPPMPAADLYAYVRAGRVLPQTMVCDLNNRQWQQAGQIPALAALFRQRGQEPIPPRPAGSSGTGDFRGAFRHSFTGDPPPYSAAAVLREAAATSGPPPAHPPASPVTAANRRDNKIAAVAVVVLGLLGFMGCVGVMSGPAPTMENTRDESTAAFLRLTRIDDPNGRIVRDALRAPSSYLIVVVGPEWHYMARGQQREMATTFYRVWDRLDDGTSGIRVVDATGNKIAGSTWTGGVEMED